MYRLKVTNKTPNLLKLDNITIDSEYICFGKTKANIFYLEKMGVIEVEKL